MIPYKGNNQKKRRRAGSEEVELDSIRGNGHVANKEGDDRQEVEGVDRDVGLASSGATIVDGDGAEDGREGLGLGRAERGNSKSCIQAVSWYSDGYVR